MVCEGDQHLGIGGRVVFLQGLWSTASELGRRALRSCPAQELQVAHRPLEVTTPDWEPRWVQGAPRRACAGLLGGLFLQALGSSSTLPSRPKLACLWGCHFSDPLALALSCLLPTSLLKAWLTASHRGHVVVTLLPRLTLWD